MASRCTQRRVTAALVIGLVGVCACGTCRAALLWYDGFSLQRDGGDYVGGGLAGQDGGAGTFFTGPWLSMPSWPQPQVVIGTSLERDWPLPPPIGDGAGAASLPWTPTIGGAVSDIATEFPNTFVGKQYRAFVEPWNESSQPVGTYYMGFLASWGTGPTLHHRALEMYDADPEDDNHRTLQLGYSEWTGLGNELTLAVRDSDGEEQFATLGSYWSGLPVWFNWDEGRVHFVVLKFELHTDDGDPETTDDRDCISVYLDPLSAIDEPSVPGARIWVNDFRASHMSAITQYTWGTGGETPAAFDELRVGTTYADACSGRVPEPTSLALLVLGMLGPLVGRRWR